MAATLVLLSPGVFLVLIAYFDRRKSTRWRWWEFLVPWLAPGIWIYLELFDRYHRPMKSLGNLVELLILIPIPAGYLEVRGRISKNAPPHWSGLVVGAGAVAVASTIFFFFPSLPE